MGTALAAAFTVRLAPVVVIAWAMDSPKLSWNHTHTHSGQKSERNRSLEGKETKYKTKQNAQNTHKTNRDAKRLSIQPAGPFSDWTRKPYFSSEENPEQQTELFNYTFFTGSLDWMKNTDSLLVHWASSCGTISKRQRSSLYSVYGFIYLSVQSAVHVMKSAALKSLELTSLCSASYVS